MTGRFNGYDSGMKPAPRAAAAGRERTGLSVSSTRHAGDAALSRNGYGMCAEPTGSRRSTTQEFFP